MLSEQFCLALRELREMMLWLGDNEYAAFLQTAFEEMRASINRSAWDGGWYRRALAPTENIGSKDSSGSKIYLNAQTWAVLGDVAETEYLPALLEAVDGMEQDFGFPLNDPPYMGYDPMVGRMSGMLPGLFENGGVYCHASAFKILMDCKLGRGDQALSTLKKIMPDSEKILPSNPVQSPMCSPTAIPPIPSIMAALTNLGPLGLRRGPCGGCMRVFWAYIGIMPDFVSTRLSPANGRARK